MNITIDFPGTEIGRRFTAGINKSANEFYGNMRELLQKCCYTMLSEIRKIAPSDSGALGFSFGYKVIQRNISTWEADVGIRGGRTPMIQQKGWKADNYWKAIYQNYGTGKYAKGPGGSSNVMVRYQGEKYKTRGKAIWRGSRFVGIWHGNKVQFKNFKGIKPKFFMEKGFDNAEPKMRQIILDGLNLAGFTGAKWTSVSGEPKNRPFSF